jgi:hypothetical protein
VIWAAVADVFGKPHLVEDRKWTGETIGYVIAAPIDHRGEPALWFAYTNEHGGVRHDRRLSPPGDLRRVAGPVDAARGYVALVDTRQGVPWLVRRNAKLRGGFDRLLGADESRSAVAFVRSGAYGYTLAGGRGGSSGGYVRKVRE